MNKSKKIAIAAMLGSLYAATVITLAPVSFGIWQVRLADALLPLSMIFGFPSALGFGLGCLVANVYGGLGIVDIVGGSLANILGCSLAWYVGRKNRFSRFLGTVVMTTTITAIVGGYLSILYGVPLEYGLIGVLIGSMISINLIGFTIEEIIQKTKVFNHS